MAAWGFATGQWTPLQFAQKAKAAGYEWAALEWDDDETGPYNRKIWPQFKTECQTHDLLGGVWFTAGGNIIHTPADAPFAIAELEGPGDYDGLILAIDGKYLPSCSIAVCTNFNLPLVNAAGIPQPEKAAPLISAGFACLTEAYLGDNPSATPDRLDFTAKQLGWSTSQPVFGVYNAPPSIYTPWADWPGVDYVGENVL